MPQEIAKLTSEIKERLAAIEKLGEKISEAKKVPDRGETHKVEPNDHLTILRLIDSSVPSENIVDQYGTPIIFGMMRSIVAGSVPQDAVVTILIGHKNKEVCDRYGRSLIKVIESYWLDQEVYSSSANPGEMKNLFSARAKYMQWLFNTAARLGFPDF